MGTTKSTTCVWFYGCAQALSYFSAFCVSFSSVPIFCLVGDGLLMILGLPYVRKIRSLSILVAHIFSHCVTFCDTCYMPNKTNVTAELLDYLPPVGKHPKPFSAVMLSSIWLCRSIFWIISLNYQLLYQDSPPTSLLHLFWFSEIPGTASLGKAISSPLLSRDQEERS